MPASGLSLAVTGPTGDLGIAIVNALERSRSVKSIVGMARRPFDPGERRWKKTEYRQGDVTDVASVRDLVRGADVVVHLAFAILNASHATRPALGSPDLLIASSGRASRVGSSQRVPTDALQRRLVAEDLPHANVTDERARVRVPRTRLGIVRCPCIRS